jgi:hypothetical protein
MESKACTISDSNMKILKKLSTESKAYCKVIPNINSVEITVLYDLIDSDEIDLYDDNIEDIELNAENIDDVLNL